MGILRNLESCTGNFCICEVVHRTFSVIDTDLFYKENKRKGEEIISLILSMEEIVMNDAIIADAKMFNNTFDILTAILNDGIQK